MSIKYNSINDLHSVARFVLHNGNKYYLQIFIDNCFHKLVWYGIKDGI